MKSLNISFLSKQLQLRQSVAMTLPSLLAVILLWLPFGFSLIGLIEEWDVIALFSKNHFWFALPDSPLIAHSLRPLTVFPHALAYFLDPNSFFYWHLLLILGLVLKGTFFSLLVYYSTGSLWWSLFAGPFVLFYPADTMQLSFRGIHINWAVTLSLIGVFSWVRGYLNLKRAISYLYGMLGGIFLFLSCCMYEIAITMTLCPFLLVMVREGFCAGLKSLWHRKMLVIVWCSGAFFYVLYMLWMSTKIQTAYQDAAFVAEPVNRIISVLPKLLSIGGVRALLGGWVDAYRMMLVEYSHYTYLFVATAMIVATILGVRRFSKESLAEDDFANGVRMFAVGVIMALMGFIPYLLTPFHMQITQRTYLLATPGAAMAWIGLFMCFSFFSKTISKALAVVFLFLGLAAQLVQFNHYIQIGEAQRVMLREIVENFDGQVGQKKLVILDGTQQVGQVWMFLDGGFSRTLTYLYDHPFNDIFLCHMPTMEWQRQDNTGFKGRCRDEGSFWVFESSSSSENKMRVDKNDMIQIVIHPDGHINAIGDLANYLDSLLYGNSTVAKRYRNILLFREPNLIYLDLFGQTNAKASFKWNFGAWWNLDKVRRGSGWRETEWQLSIFNHRSFAWLVNQNGTLVFPLEPLNKAYKLNMRIALFMSPQARNAMKININDFPLQYHWVDAEVLEAAVPPGVLRNGENVILFNFPLESNGLYTGLAEMQVLSAE